jgi:hypothetical protein
VQAALAFFALPALAFFAIASMLALDLEQLFYPATIVSSIACFDEVAQGGVRALVGQAQDAFVASIARLEGHTLLTLPDQGCDIAKAGLRVRGAAHLVAQQDIVVGNRPVFEAGIDL